MKINETGRIGAINSYQRNVDSNPYGSEKKSRKKDEVSISSEAMEMLQSQDRVNDIERESRIEDLKKQVSTGTYHVEAGEIAEKLLPYFKSYEKE